MKQVRLSVLNIPNSELSPLTSFRGSRWKDIHWLCYVAVFLGACARLFALGSHSLLLDEAFVAVGARDIAYNHTPMWQAISNAPFVWCIAQLISAFGDSPFLLRLGSAAAGTLSIYALYSLGRRLFDSRIAAISALLYALHPFAIAYQRVLFADPYQVLFVILGWIALDDLMMGRTHRSRVWLFVVWALAFLMKYNAIVPAELWILGGLLAGRYRLRNAVLAGAIVLLSSIAMLLPWPYDAPVWLASFLQKGGSYSLAYAHLYFAHKLDLVLFGLAEALVVAGGAIVLLRRDATSRSVAHLILFVLTYLVTVIFLGRTFSRYLLMLAGPACLLAGSIGVALWHGARRPRRIMVRFGAGVVLAVMFGVWAYGAITESDAYIEYLQNDISMTRYVSDVRALETQGRRGYWILSEPIGAYYLGFTQDYSRSHGVRPQNAEPLASLNFFEYRPVAYSEERRPYSVMAVQKLLRTRGLFSAISHPALFLAEARAVADSVSQLPESLSFDYLTSDSVRRGDLLLLHTGTRSVDGEPILTDVSHEPLPPQLDRLPLDRFHLLRVYAPQGIVNDSSSQVPRLDVRGYILERK